MRLIRFVLYGGVAVTFCGVVAFGQRQVDRPFVPGEDNVPPTTDVRIFKSANIQSSIQGEKLGRLLEGKDLFSLNLLHRKGEEPTIHGSVVDLYFVQKGKAVLEHGGTAVDAKPSGGRVGDMRAASIKGGTRTVVEAGDIVFIPPGIPHRFVAGESDIVYFNVHFPGK
jgi:hypothetical protein